ncbi:MAG: YraN family protein, partial [Patescibacteria group bacterium]
MNKTKLGRLGEDLACEYLVDKGYKIIGRNYREKWDELDIVARSQDKTLIFVEVKTINTAGGDENSMIMPEDNLTKSKMRKLKRACQS